MKMDHRFDAAAATPTPGALGRIIQLFAPEDERADAPAPSQDAQLLEEIARFILAHDIGVSAVTLTSALEFVSGENLHLVRKIREREDSGKAVTRIWLEGMVGPARRNDGARKLEKVIEHLETNVEALASAATTARDATQDYNTALTANEKRLSGTDPQGVTEVVDLVREMIGHARLLEDRLTATEAESKRMREDLKRARDLADRDHLTGLPNRRAFERRLWEARAGLGMGREVTIGFCDIDHFKAFNDSHGHDVGDRVLRLVAEHLSAATGDDCYVARHGGEEFALLFDGMGVDQAVSRLDDARAKLKGRQLKDRRTGKALGGISFSAGVARCVEGEEPGDAMKLADQALYAAKQQGRDRVVASAG